MIFSEKHLRHLANLPNTISLDQIVNAINSIGFEVENVTNFHHVEGIKFGKVLTVSKNPNSEKLNVCQIQFNDRIRTIQTAAQNVKANDYLMAFIPGSKYQNQVIETKKLAHIDSEGMLISLAELGFDQALLTQELQDNIFIINEAIELDWDPIEYLNLHDNLIEVSILTNRSDAQSYYVFAQELAAYFQTNFEFKLKQKPEHLITNSKLKLIANDKQNCLMGAIVKIDQNDFYLDLKRMILVLKANLKLGNHFDNYCAWMMLQTGIYPQVIDYDKLDDHNLKITTTEEQLTVLANQKNIISKLAIAVEPEFRPNPNSKNLLFIFSQLDPKQARTNIKLTKTNSSISINSTKKIANGSIMIAYQLLTNQFSSISQLINWTKTPNLKIKFDKKYLIDYAGKDITKDYFYQKALNALTKLGFIFNKNKTLVTIPDYRHDLLTMQDLVEEVFRFYGLNNFEPQQPLLNSKFIPSTNHNLEQKLTAMGYTQVWTYTLINKTKNDFNPFGFKKNFDLKTFISEEYNAIRNSIALPLLDVYQYNLKRKIDKLSLFDLGMINDRKALMICSNQKSYLEIKTDLIKLTNQAFDILPLDDPKLHPHYNAGLYLGGQQVGWIGKFNPFYIDENVIFAEIFLDVIYQPKNLFINYNNQPLKERDITVSLKNNQSPITIINEIKFHFDYEIFSIDLIDVFHKNELINWTYRIKFNPEITEPFDQLITKILSSELK